MSKDLESLKHQWISSGLNLGLALTYEAREAVRLKLEANDFAGAFALVTDPTNCFDSISWGSAEPDILAARILQYAIKQGKDLAAAEAVVIEALLLALVRYVGPLRFSDLLSRLMPSSNA